MFGGVGKLCPLQSGLSIIIITSLDLDMEQVYKDTVATDPGFIFLLMVGLYSTVALMFFVLLVMLLRLMCGDDDDNDNDDDLYIIGAVCLSV